MRTPRIIISPHSPLTASRPSAGTALLTLFKVSTADWSDDAADLPLLYASFYSVVSDPDPAAAGEEFMIKDTNELTTVFAYLPAGLSSLGNKVLCCAPRVFPDDAGTCSFVSVAVSVSISASIFFPVSFS